MKHLQHKTIKNNSGAQGEYSIFKYKAGTRELISVHGPYHNLVVTSDGYGRNLIARAIAGALGVYQLEVDTGKIGTGVTAPANGDTDLVTPTLTVTKTNQSVSNNVVTIDFFITDTQLTNGTYTEFGVFADTQLFARSLISPNYTKASNEDTLIVYTITLTT